MSIPVSTIISSLFKALPGLLSLLNSFRKKPEPSSDDISAKAKNEIEALEEWKAAARKEAE